MADLIHESFPSMGQVIESYKMAPTGGRTAVTPSDWSMQGSSVVTPLMSGGMRQTKDTNDNYMMRKTPRFPGE